jgi:hypothetical protein
MIEGSGGDMFDYELEFWRLPSEESLAPNSELKHVLEDAIELFLGNREEKFQYERAIRLFQFQAWVFMPCFETIRWAGLIAATKIARSIEMNEYLPYDGDEPKFDHYPAITMERILELQKKSPAYSRIYNKFIAPWGGLTALLEAPSPRSFDSLIAKRKENPEIVADLVDYRLRYVLSGQDIARGATINHAFFFKWWPTHDMPGKRGVTVKGKSPSAKTMLSYWNSWNESAIFIYLHERHGVKLLPPKTDVADEGAFVSRISIAAEQVIEMERLLGSYAYIADAMQRTTGEEQYIVVPKGLPRTPVSVAPFSDVERDTIAHYEEYKDDMWQ